jgi:hypothetical protein
VPRRLELVHTTEVIPTTTSRMLAQAVLDSASDSAASLEPARELTDSSLSAKPVAREVLTRSPPSRRRTLVVVGLALAAVAAALTWPSPRRTEPLARPAAQPPAQTATLPPAPPAPEAPAPAVSLAPPAPVLAASAPAPQPEAKQPAQPPIAPAVASDHPAPRARPSPAKPAPAERPNATPPATPYPRPAPPADPYADRL